MLKAYVVIMFLGTPASGDIPGTLKFETTQDRCWQIASQIASANPEKITAFCSLEKQQ